MTRGNRLCTGKKSSLRNEKKKKMKYFETEAYCKVEVSYQSQIPSNSEGWGHLKVLNKVTGFPENNRLSDVILYK